MWHIPNHFMIMLPYGQFRRKPSSGQPVTLPDETYWHLQRIRLKNMHGMSTKVGWQVYRLTMMHLSNFTKFSLFFNMCFNIVSPAVRSIHFLIRCRSARIPVVWKLSSWTSEKVLNCRYAWPRYAFQWTRRDATQPFGTSRYAQQPLQP